MSGKENIELPRKRGNDSAVYHGVPVIDDYGDRQEKPWQRVIYEVTRKGAHLYEPVKSVPSALLILLLGAYLLLGYLTQLVEDDMPRIINENDIARDNSETFSEEASWRYLKIILGDQPRVSGTAYHLQKTIDLKNLLNEVAREARQPVRTDWQMIDGDYWLNFNIPYANAYQNVSNIIALLEGESGFHPNGTIGTTLLVNCHYDSVPYAMGASDDAIFCAVMMETLSKLSRRSTKLKHNIVFLFNGAEENPLQGSHAFLYHPWSRGVTNVINLDAAGMNGKPIVFQVTDTRLMNAYRRVVPNPHGQSVGEFLFKTGIIPSDTDFRIWRDFGNFHGLDIAFVKWGQVYHTRYDHPDTVLNGVQQNAGNMLLNLVAALADMEELSSQVEPEAAVYYDYLNSFLVTYSLSAAIAVDVIIALYGLLSVAYYIWLVGPRWTSIQELLFCAGGRLLSMAVGFLVAFIFVLIMAASTWQLRYLSEMWIVVPLYWIPYLVTAVGVAHLYDMWRTKKSGLNRSIRCLQAQAATRFIIAVVLLIMSCVSYVTTIRYIFTVPLFIMSTMSLFSLTIVRYVRLQAWQQLLMEIALSLPTTMFLVAISLKMNSIMLPTVGRMPTDNPDYIIGLVNLGLAALMSSSLSGLELLFSRRRIWIPAAPLALAAVIIMFIPIYPYRDNTIATQRHYWFHSEIISYNYNNEVTERFSGVVVTKHDAYTLDTVLPALRDKGINLVTRSDFGADCERHVHCNLPLYRVRFMENLHDVLFLSTGPPAEFNPSPTLTAQRNCIGTTCTIAFTMIGSAHSLITFKPRSGVNVTSWSLNMPLKQSFLHTGRPVYAIIHSHPTYIERFPPYIFSATFNIPLSLQNQAVVDVAYHSHKIHHPEDYTQEYRNLVNAVPNYFNIASFLSFRKNYEF